MGMFDSIKVDEHNVCNIAIPVDEYQTYSLDNQCWTYRITQDGKLIVENKPSDYAKPYDEQFQRCLTDWAFGLARINFGQFEGVIHMGGDVKGTGEWKDYTLLIHNSEIQFVMSYGEVIYSRDPESNDNFKEAIERECNQPSISATQDIMFQQMMSTKHLLMKPATMEGVRAANSILEETMAKLARESRLHELQLTELKAQYHTAYQNLLTRITNNRGTKDAESISSSSSCY